MLKTLINASFGLCPSRDLSGLFANAKFISLIFSSVNLSIDFPSKSLKHGSLSVKIAGNKALNAPRKSNKAKKC